VFSSPSDHSCARPRFLRLRLRLHLRAVHAFASSLRFRAELESDFTPAALDLEPLSKRAS
jgi:hypothetical protein